MSYIAAAAHGGGVVADPQAAYRVIDHWEAEGSREALRDPLNAAAVAVRAQRPGGMQSTELGL